LITTFKSELIENADRLFGIQTKNGVSDMKRIDKEEAYEIVGMLEDA